MDAITHALIGYLLGQTLAPGSPELVALTTAAAVVPDLDTVAWLAPKRLRGLVHRGATHSLLAGALLTLGTAAAFGLTRPDLATAAAACAALGFLSHVTLDVLNWGCQLYWPWRKTFVEHTVQRGLLGTAAASVLAWGAILATRWNAPGLATAVEATVAAAWIAYLALRLAAKTRVLRQTGPGALALPTANPLVWIVVPSAPRPGEAEFEARERPGRTVHALWARSGGAGET